MQMMNIVIIYKFHIDPTNERLTFCLLDNCANFSSSADFFKTTFFEKKNLSGTPSESQTVWIPMRPDVLSSLILLQTVCKDYQQTTLHVVGIEFLWDDTCICYLFFPISL